MFRKERKIIFIILAIFVLALLLLALTGCSLKKVDDSENITKTTMATKKK